MKAGVLTIKEERSAGSHGRREEAAKKLRDNPAGRDTIPVEKIQRSKRLARARKFSGRV
jgi:hypothetical protein